MKQYKDLNQLQKNLFNRLDNELRNNKAFNIEVLKALLFKYDKQNYEEGFNILYAYFDSIPDEEKKQVDKDLKECGL